MAISSPLKWHGGKGAFQGKLAKWIISLMPPHTHYVEPYFGGGSVLLAKNPNGVSEVVNDLDQSLINFWHIIRMDDTFASFRRKVGATPFSEDHWGAAMEIVRLHIENAGMPVFSTEESLVRWAVSFFIVCRQSMSGRMKDFAPLTKNRIRRGMNEQVSAWLSVVERLPEVHARLKRVVIVGPKDAKEVIRQQDGKKTLFYLDPPYLHETRRTTTEYGPNEMTTIQHQELLGLISGIKGKFLISGYMSASYHAMELTHGWNRHEFTIPNNAARGKKKREMTECIWTNFEVKHERNQRKSGDS